jgi:hypothetical protein
MNAYARLMTVLVAGVVCLNAGGCVKPPIYDPGKVDLSKYDRLVIAPFDAGPKAPQFTASRNADLCAKIKEHVKCRPEGFREIDSTPRHTPNELILTGTAVDYDPGNQFLRAMLIGLGPAHFRAPGPPGGRRLGPGRGRALEGVVAVRRRRSDRRRSG